MEEFLRIDVLDVGHGSAVILRGADSNVLIDTGPGVSILKYLAEEGIERLEAVVLSHADRDHVAGLLAILNNDVPVGRIYVNPDAMKTSKLWLDLVFAIEDAERRQDRVVQSELGAGREVYFAPGVRVVALAPRTSLRLRGPGGHTAEGRKLDPNSMSIVVRVDVNETPVLLLPGDLDDLGLQHLLASGESLCARNLVLSHHGGLMGTAATTPRSVQALCSAVSPSRVFVSNGRGAPYHNPRPAVIAAVRAEFPNVHIACTQLSELCARITPVLPRQLALFAAGKLKNVSCAGSSTIMVDSDGNDVVDLAPHKAFVALNAPHALCHAAPAGSLDTPGPDAVEG